MMTQVYHFHNHYDQVRLHNHYDQVKLFNLIEMG